MTRSISGSISGNISSSGGSGKHIKAPVWVTAAGSLGSFNAGDAVSVQLGATDPQSLPLTYALAMGSVLPSGITLSSAGRISGIMAQVAVDTTTSFSVVASNGSKTASRAFSLTDLAIVVLAVPSSIIYTPAAPSLQTSVAAGATVGTFTVAMSDGSLYSGDNTLTNDDSGNFSLSPATGDGTLSVAALSGLSAGQHTVTVQATQNAVAVSADLTISVVTGTTGTAPVWVTPAGFLGSFVDLATLAIQLRATDPNGLPLTYSLTGGALPSGVTLNASGLISGTLPSVSVDTTYNFTVSVSNGTLATAQAFSLTETTSSSTTTLTTLIVANPGAAILPANSFVQFGHGWGVGDLPSGSILTIIDDLGAGVPVTAMRRSTGGGSSVRFSDNIARLPNSIAAPLAITSITHSGTTATVTTASPHGLSTGAVVHLEGQAPDDYCGAPTITVTGASTFTYTMPTTPATNATTAGVMNYCRVLTLKSTTGSWNNTLPNSKSAANIIADITANFDNLSLQLTSMTGSAGSPTGSGTWNANLATALAATGTAGQLRTLASGQGPQVCDIVALMKFVDNTGGAKHATMSAWFYVTAFLDQTTGAVQELRCRTWIDNSLVSAAMDYYTYQATLKLGSTTVRSSGLSTNAAIDGKVQSFAPAAVSTSTGVINIPSHGFVGGETVRLTTTGTLPTGFSLATDYAVIWIDTNNIGVTTLFGNGNQIGNSSKVTPSTQGSGTHTVTCWLHSALRNRLPYCRNDGLADRWTGKTGAFAPQIGYPIHDSAYLQSTKLVPPVDISVNLLNKIAIRGNAGPTLDVFCYGACGSLQYDQDTGGAGAHHEYGGPWTDVPLRRLRYCSNRTGYVQTLRVDALMVGAWDMSLINDDTTWRTSVVNNGPNRAGGSYSGMPTPRPTAQIVNNNFTNFTQPTSKKLQNGLQTYSYSHRYILLHRLYFFEGGQDIHDLMLIDSANTLLPKSDAVFPTVLQISLKRYLIDGVQYFTVNPDGSEPRTDAWMMQVLVDAAMLGDDTAPEKPYLGDVLNDTLKVANYLINTYAVAHDPGWLGIGAWGLPETGKGGPGSTSGTAASNSYETTTGFMQSYLGETYGHCYRMYPTSDFLGLITQLYKLVDNLYRVVNGWMSNSYILRVKRAPGLNASPNGALSITAITEPLLRDSSIDGILYRTDGTVIGLNNGDFTPVFPALNDRHEVSSSQDDVQNYYDGPPPELTDYGVYYIRQPSGSYLGWKYATTNSDGTIVSTYSAASSSTLNGAINNSTTTITTHAVLAFSAGNSGVALPLIVVGTEIMLVTAGKGTTTLTVQRGAYGSTAASALDGAAAYVPYLSMFFADYQNRTVAFPPTGHAYRITGAAADVPDGYLTMMRAQAGYGYLTGVIAKTAYSNADAWFQDVTVPAGSGAAGFAANNSLKDSINTALT